MSQLLKYLKFAPLVFSEMICLMEKANVYYNVHTRVKFRNKIFVWYDSIVVRQYNDKITSFFRGLKMCHNLAKRDV